MTTNGARERGVVIGAAGRLRLRYIGLNNFEACLRFQHGGTTKYYGGGAGIYDSPQDILAPADVNAVVSDLLSDALGRGDPSRVIGS